MAVLALTNAKILAGQADLSGFSNNVEVSAEVEELDATTFGSNGFKSSVGGLRKVDIKVGGLWEATSAIYPDDRLFADLGVASVVMTISPTGATVQDIAYFTRVLRPSYMLGAQVGELVGFESTAVNSDSTPLVRGKVSDNQARTATGTSTAVQLAVPSASTRVVAGVHVLAVSGTSTPTLTPTLQGDNASGFPSPATVVAGTAMTAIGSQWLAGSYGVTVDDWYRLSYVISGTSPSFTVVASIGVTS
jgi:hypothetical protein